MQNCATAWSEADIPALGTAPDARFWVALEQPGPWGAKAFTQSHLDPALGARLEELVATAGGRLLLVRSPAEREDAAAPRRVLVGGGPSASPWLGRCTVTRPEDLIHLLGTEPAALATAPRPDWLEPCEPVLLVCSNGKRDRCCAVSGGRLARSLAVGHPEQVWEATHLGGHRFAATALALPSRQVLARVDEALGHRALSGELLCLDARHDRGRSCLPQRSRVADAWLRDRDQVADPTAWALTEQDDLVRVVHADGRVEDLLVCRGSSEELELPESCGKAAVPVTWWQVEPA
ncbi:sucrase ferredoxin [Luteococcus peritonei]|uniref:Sucrase ferredoxin n=1 Tax=Luteococcus peritonei TaxID=88874 RepID=A0ABW4RXJ9_9ACTN